MWDVFKDWIFDIIHFFYDFCGDWGLAIIISDGHLPYSDLAFDAQADEIVVSDAEGAAAHAELQRKYADDQPRLQEEMQKLYAEVKFNPLAGCLPMLLQMPIFMALFQVLSEMGSRTSGTTYEFYNLVPSLVMRPSEALAVGFGTFVPYLILMVIFAGATFLPMVLMQMGNKDNPQRKQTMIMAAVMSVFMLWISWSSPAGVLLFWGASSLMGIAQQQISMRIMKKRDAEAAKPTR